MHLLHSEHLPKLLSLKPYFVVIFLALLGYFWLFTLPSSLNQIFAASYTWDGGGTDGTCGGVLGDGNKWSCAFNWSSDIVPAAADTVTFNATSSKDAVIDPGFGGVVTSINIAAGYTGTITQQRSFQTTSTFTQSAGTYTASNHVFDVDNIFTLNAGVFNASSTNTYFASNFTLLGGTFNHNNGIITFEGSGGTITCNNTTFNLVNFTNTGQKSINSNCSLPIGNNPSVGPNLVLSGTLSGTGNLTISSGSFTIDTNAFLSGFNGITIPSSLVVNGSTNNFSSFTNFVVGGSVILNSGSLSLPSGADLNGPLTISGGTFNAPAGNMTLAGALSITGTPTFNANGGTIIFDGTLTATLSCNNVTFNSVIFNSTGGDKTIASNCTLPLGHNPTLSRGVILNGTLSGSGLLTVAANSFTLNPGATLNGFSGLSAPIVNIAGATLNLSNYTQFTTTTFGITSGTFTPPNSPIISTFTGGFTQSGGTFLGGGSNLDFNGVGTSVSISGGNFTAPSGNMTVAAGFNISGTAIFNASGGTLIFDGSGNASLSCNNVTFNLVRFNVSGSRTVNNNCNLPLGNNPNLNNTSIVLLGTLSGTGTMSSGAMTLTLNSGANLSGFSGYTSTGAVVVSGGNVDLSSYTQFFLSSILNVSSGSISLPPSTVLNGQVLLTGGTLTFNGAADLNFTLTISGGTFNAPSGNMTLAGNLSISGSPTFNANNGTIIFDGGTSNLNCNNVIFNLVVLNSGNSTKTIGQNCNLPLGNNPTASRFMLNGTLSGTGVLSLSSHTLFNTTAILNGFDGIYSSPVGELGVNGANLNLSNYASFVSDGPVALHSGDLSLPIGTDINGNLRILGGTFTAPSGNLYLAADLNITGGSFNHNNGTLILDGSTQGVLNCNGVSFNQVLFNHPATTLKVVNANCNLPLGFNPTITGSVRLNSASALLSGSGVLTNTAEVASSFDMVAGQLSGFSGLVVYGSLLVNGMDLDLSTYSLVTMYGRNTDNALRISGGSLTAPTGTMTLYDRFRRSGGTFNHNNGTVSFLCEPIDITIGIHDASFTFYNLISTPTIPCSFVTSDGETITVLNNLTWKGIDASNRLSLLSGVPGAQWSLDASNANLIDIEYLNVTDSNSITRIIQAAGLNVTDGGNNTNWNFGNPIISNVGSVNVLNNTYNKSNPTFNFTITDPDNSNQVRYTILIDNNSDFSSPEVNVTSVLLNQGNLSFTPSTTLAEDKYYWRLVAEDAQQGLSSAFTNEFSLDKTAPTGKVVINNAASQTIMRNVILKFAATDNLSGVTSMIISENPNFSGASYQAYATSKYWVLSSGFGTKTIYVRFRDAVGNQSIVYTAKINYTRLNIPAPTAPNPAPVTPVDPVTPPIDIPVSNPQPIPVHPATSQSFTLFSCLIPCSIALALMLLLILLILVVRKRKNDEEN